MRRRYRISDQANEDLDSIADDIGAQSPASANNVLDGLLEAFRLLADHSELGTLRADIAPGLRMFTPPKPAASYVILFYPIENGIEVSNVIHSARDWINLIPPG